MRIYQKTSYKSRLFIYLSILVSFIVVSISGMTFHNIRNVLINKEEEIAINTIKQLEKTTEIMLSDADSSLLNISLDPQVEGFMLLYKYRQYTQSIEIMNLMDRLKNYVAYKDYIKSCFIYYLEEDKVIDVIAKRISSIDEVASSKTKERMISEKELILHASDQFIEEKDYAASKIYSIDTSYEKNLVTIVKPVNPLFLEPNVLLIMTFDNAYFQDVVNEFNSNKEASILIFDKNNESITGANLPKVEALCNLSAFDAQDSATYFLKDNGVNYLVAYITSDLFGWRFYYILPTTSIVEELNMIKYYFLILASIAFIVGLLGASFFSGRLYKPIHGIVDVLKRTPKLEGDHPKDDIEYINTSVKELIEENKNFEVLMAENRPILRNHLLLRLLKESIESTKESVLDKLQFHNVNIFPTGYYRTCIVGIDEYEKIVDKYSEKQAGLLQIYKKEVILSIEKEYPIVKNEIVHTDDNKLVMILSIQVSDTTLAKEKTDAFINRVHDELGNAMSYSLTIGKSRLTNTLEDIAKCYNESRVAYDYKIIKGYNSVIDIEEMPIIESQYENYPSELESKIIKEMKSGNKDGLSKELKAYFNFIGDKISQKKYLEFVSLCLLDGTLKACHELGIHSQQIFINRDNLFEEIVNQSTIEEMHKWFEALYLSIMKFIEDKKESRTKEVLDSILSYIDENYVEPDLSLDKIAENVHFSVPYLVKLFRQTSSYTIKEYIIIKRMEMAITLLESTDLKVNCISQKIGYTNTSSFIKGFKKYTGHTPGEYRKLPNNQ